MSERKELAARLRTLAAGEPADSLFIRAADLLDPPAQGRTVRVRIAGQVYDDGSYHAREAPGDTLDLAFGLLGADMVPKRRFIVEADVPAWEPPPTVEGEVS